jgi:AcrR family transcriptional regulator
MAPQTTTKQRPGRRALLDLDLIVTTALSIADAEGLDALSMRRLARELDVGVMSLYSHVRTKDELVEHVAELAVTELEIPERGTWDERLRDLFTNLRNLLLRHPAVLYVDTARPLSGPGALRSTNAALRMLREGGLDGAAAVRGLSTLSSYAFGSAIFTLNRSGVGRADYDLHVRGADPAVLEQVSELAQELIDRGGDDEFQAGLRLIIDALKRQPAGDAST